MINTNKMHTNFDMQVKTKQKKHTLIPVCPFRKIGSISAWQVGLG